MPCRLPTKRWLARSVLPHSLTSNWKRLPEPVFVPPGHLFVRLPVLLPVRRSAIAPQRSEKTEPPQQLPSLCESWSKTSSRSEEHTSELQSPCNLVCRLLLET